MSQDEQILAMLERGELVTPYTVYLRTGSLACHSRISELRERGYDIVCAVVREGRTKHGVYRLVK